MPAASDIVAMSRAQLADHFAKLIDAFEREAPNRVRYQPTTRSSLAKSMAIYVDVLASAAGEKPSDDGKWWRDPANLVEFERIGRANPAWKLSTLRNYAKNLAMFVNLAYDARGSALIDDDMLREAVALSRKLTEESDAIARAPDAVNDEVSRNYVPLRRLEDKFTDTILPAFRQINKSLDAEDDETRVKIEDALVCAMNLWEPPCRSVLSDCAIVDRADQLVGRNCIYVPTSGLAKQHVHQDDHMRQGTIPPKTYELLPKTSDLLRQSLAVWPRMYLFCRDGVGDEPMTKAMYQRAVKHAFQIGNRAPGVQTLRKIVVVSFWFRNGHNLPATTWLADRMRHSLGRVLETYYKLGESIASQIPPPPYDISSYAPPVPMPDPTTWVPGDGILNDDEDGPAAAAAAAPAPIPAPAPAAAARRKKGPAPGSRHNTSQLSPNKLRRALNDYNAGKRNPEPDTQRMQQLFQDDAGKWHSHLLP